MYPVFGAACWKFLGPGMVMRYLVASIFLSTFLLMPARASATPHATPAEISPAPPVIVVGFLGGFVKHNNLVHSEVQLAERLRQEYPEGVQVETFESYRGAKARQKI